MFDEKSVKDGAATNNVFSVYDSDLVTDGPRVCSSFVPLPILLGVELRDFVNLHRQ